VHHHLIEPLGSAIGLGWNLSVSMDSISIAVDNGDDFSTRCTESHEIDNKSPFQIVFQ
jgi:hypothetical protein